MKKLLISFAALALLAACNNDDDDEKQLELLPKKIVKIEDGEETTTFGYNKEGRITSMHGENYTYTTNQIICKDRAKTETYTLEDGRVTKFVYKETSEGYSNYYSYNAGYLSKMTSTETDEGYSYETTYDYTFKGGNLAKLVYSEIETEDGKTTEWYDTYEFTYGKQANNMNLDLMDIIGDISENWEYLLGIAGNRSANLPEKMVNTWTSEEDGKEIKYEDTYTYRYTTDAEGYITKVTVDRIEKENGKETEKETIEYVITYEK